MTESNYFEELNKVKCKVEKKGRFNYVSWASAWKEVKKRYPQANYRVYERQDYHDGEIHGSTKPYFPISKEGGGFVKVGVTINDIEHIEWYPILDNYNKPIKHDFITAFDINTAIKRALAKAIAQHGMGLYVYEGEDLPEDS